MNVIAKGAHGTAIQWPGFSEDAWPQDLLDFFAPLNQNQILNQVIKATYNVDHFDTQLLQPTGWAPLPDDAYIVKYNQTGAMYAFDPTSFAAEFRIV